MFDFHGQNPQFPRRLLRLLSMGCGISKFDPKEAGEPSPYNPPHCYRNFYCLGGDSKPLIGEGGNAYSPEELSRKGDSSITRKVNAGGLLKEEAAAEKTKMNMNRGGDSEEKEDGTGRRNLVKEKIPESVCVHSKLKENEEGENSEPEDCRKIEEEGNDHNYNGVYRGGSPSFREYCLDFDSRSRSIKSEGNWSCTDNNDGAQENKWLNVETPDPEKVAEGQIGKKERKGRSLMNALHLGKQGGVRNFLNASRRHHLTHHHDTSNKLLAKAS